VATTHSLAAPQNSFKPFWQPSSSSYCAECPFVHLLQDSHNLFRVSHVPLYFPQPLSPYAVKSFVKVNVTNIQLFCWTQYTSQLTVLEWMFGLLCFFQLWSPLVLLLRFQPFLISASAVIGCKQLAKITEKTYSRIVVAVHSILFLVCGHHHCLFQSTWNCSLLQTYCSSCHIYATIPTSSAAAWISSAVMLLIPGDFFFFILAMQLSGITHAPNKLRTVHDVYSLW